MTETNRPAHINEAEWQLRVDLAACYRMVALKGWDDLIYTHISARVPGPEHHFLINPYDMMFEEITASSLVKIDLDGNKVEDSPHPVNPAGFTIHSAIHQSRDDAQCVLHLHTLDGVAVSAQPEGLLPISQQAMFPYLAGVGYHDYEGVAVNEDEKERLVADLGQHRFMILRNHGLLTVGDSVADAFLSMYTLQNACSIQIKAQAGGKVSAVPDQAIENLINMAERAMSDSSGAKVWPAVLRKLDRDNPGYTN